MLMEIEVASARQSKLMPSIFCSFPSSRIFVLHSTCYYMISISLQSSGIGWQDDITSSCHTILLAFASESVYRKRQSIAPLPTNEKEPRSI